MPVPFSLYTQLSDARVKQAIDTYVRQRASAPEREWAASRHAAVIFLAQASDFRNSGVDNVAKLTRRLATQLNGDEKQKALESSAGIVIDLIALQELSEKRPADANFVEYRQTVKEMTDRFYGNGPFESYPEAIYGTYVKRGGDQLKDVHLEARKAFVETVLQEVPPFFDSSPDFRGL